MGKTWENLYIADFVILFVFAGVHYILHRPYRPDKSFNQITSHSRFSFYFTLLGLLAFAFTSLIVFTGQGFLSIPRLLVNQALFLGEGIGVAFLTASFASLVSHTPKNSPELLKVWSVLLLGLVASFFWWNASSEHAQFNFHDDDFIPWAYAIGAIGCYVVITWEIMTIGPNCLHKLLLKLVGLVMLWLFFVWWVLGAAPYDKHHSGTVFENRESLAGAFLAYNIVVALGMLVYQAISADNIINYWLTSVYRVITPMVVELHQE